MLDREILLARLIRKVSPEPNTGCWLWTGAHNGRYGCIRDPNCNRQVYAHRLSYELHCERIPDGMEIDHLCKQELCVNPEHLEVVTRRENNIRSNSASSKKFHRTHCAHGHLFDDANTHWTRTGHRKCRECIKRHQADEQGRKKFRRRIENHAQTLEALLRAADARLRIVDQGDWSTGNPQQDVLAELRRKWRNEG